MATHLHRYTSLRIPLNLDTETPISVYHKLCSNRPYSFLFESAEVTGATAMAGQAGGRYSFIGFDPIEVLTFEEDAEENPLEVLRARMTEVRLEGEHAGRFEAGFVGYFSYETVRHFERIPLPRTRAASGIPEGVFFLPRVIVVFDHLKHTVELHYLMSLEGDVEANRAEADRAVGEVKSRLSQAAAGLAAVVIEGVREPYALHPSAAVFEARVDRAKEAIRAGEVFQVVLSHSMEIKTEKDPLTLYRLLRRVNPSPYLYLMNFDGFSVVGASPETLVRVGKSDEGDGLAVVVRPIAGTRPRGVTPQEDARLEQDLLSDPKESAEHMMLVDLGRNDVGRISREGTVTTPVLARVERFSSVMHMVSTVTGRVREGVDLFDVFRSCFPAGTLSGAPKIRACELIAELEDRRRGLYGGAVGYFGLDGTMDFAIAIRTMVHRGDTVYVQAGAGVVYDSVPRKEHQECLHKATSCLSIL